MQVKISRTNRNRAYNYQTIKGEKMARELSDGLEPSQLAQLVKAHHIWFIGIQNNWLIQRTFCSMAGQFGS